MEDRVLRDGGISELQGFIDQLLVYMEDLVSWEEGSGG